MPNSTSIPPPSIAHDENFVNKIMSGTRLHENESQKEIRFSFSYVYRLEKTYCSQRYRYFVGFNFCSLALNEDVAGTYSHNGINTYSIRGVYRPPLIFSKSLTNSFR